MIGWWTIETFSIYDASKKIEKVWDNILGQSKAYPFLICKSLLWS